MHTVKKMGDYKTVPLRDYKTVPLRDYKNTLHIDPDKVCGYVFSALVCRYCDSYINSSQPVYYGWNRPFCSTTCRSKHNTKKTNKSVFNLMVEFISHNFE